MTQTEQVLQAFKLKRIMTTAQIHALPYITNARARISDLRKLGHIITATPIKGKHQSSFQYLGQSDMMTDEKPLGEWRPIGNGFECRL